MTLTTPLRLRENRSYFRSRNWSREYLGGAGGAEGGADLWNHSRGNQAKDRGGEEGEASAAGAWAGPALQGIIIP